MRVGAATAVALALLPFVSSSSPRAAKAPLYAVERTVYLMGTRATLVVRATDRVAALRQLDRMVRSLERTEAELSTWKRESVLSALNRQPVGEPLTLSAPVCALWGKLTAWHQDTEGAFDPAIGALTAAWGLREGGRRPSAADLASAMDRSGLAQLRFDAVGCRLTRVAAVTLDAGAFGKGEALRRLAGTRAASGGDWMVDLGGQIAVSGATPAEGWSVAVAHPARRAESALEIVLGSGSLATSGASERSFALEDEKVAHILDPRTGRTLHRPETATVWHEDALAADVLSTGLYVLGPEAGLRYADEHELTALFLAPAGDSNVTLRASRAFRRRFPRISETRP